MTASPTRAEIRNDLLLVVFLIGVGVVCRLLPHAYGFLPVAASGLFAARMLRIPVLSLVVPVAAMALSGPFLGGDDWRITVALYIAIMIPALLGLASRRFDGALPVVAAVLGGSLGFFVLSNAAVWAFSGLYEKTLSGLTQCFVAAIPFLDKTVMGDLFWSAVLFGGTWLVQQGGARLRGVAH